VTWPFYPVLQNCDPTLQVDQPAIITVIEEIVAEAGGDEKNFDDFWVL
jgi:hypothetical protein